MGCLFGGDKKRKDVLMFGLDRAGKTTILNRLKGYNPYKYSAISSVTWNVEHIDDKNMNIWDLSGSKMCRSRWNDLLEQFSFDIPSGMIYVIDCNDRNRLDYDHMIDNDENAKCWLCAVLNHEIFRKNRNIPLLIIANKQDMSDAISVDKLGVYLGIYHKHNPQKYYDINIWLIRGIIDEIISYLPLQRSDTWDDRPVQIIPNVSPIYLNTRFITQRTHEEVWEKFEQFDKQFPNVLMSGIDWLDKKMRFR
eukprot:7319_1